MEIDLAWPITDVSCPVMNHHKVEVFKSHLIRVNMRSLLLGLSMLDLGQGCSHRGPCFVVAHQVFRHLPGIPHDVVSQGWSWAPVTMLITKTSDLSSPESATARPTPYWQQYDRAECTARPPLENHSRVALYCARQGVKVEVHEQSSLTNEQGVESFVPNESGPHAPDLPRATAGISTLPRSVTIGPNAA